MGKGGKILNSNSAHAVAQVGVTNRLQGATYVPCIGMRYKIILLLYSYNIKKLIFKYAAHVSRHNAGLA